MIIKGARVAIGANTTEPLDLKVRGGRLSITSPSSTDTEAKAPVLDLRGFLLLPGLINAHDHLEFNLFPKLGRSDYPNARNWASEIHQPALSPLKEHLALPKPARMLWGGLKNLFSGVTTVAHHNRLDHPALDASFPVNVVKHFGWAHSLDFSPDMMDRFLQTPEGWPFILHAAEGVDEKARGEIRQLDSLQVLTGRTVLVHAIGMDQTDIHLLHERRCAVVWCPSSNSSTYGRTLSAPILRSDLKIILGTDSALTAPVDLLHEIGVAKREHLISDRDLFDMVTIRSASVLHLADGEGTIRDGGVADFVVTEDRGQTPAEALQNLHPLMVIVRGKVRLVAPALLNQAAKFCTGDWHSVGLEGRGSWLTDVNLPALHNETVGALGAEYRLAGRRVTI